MPWPQHWHQARPMGHRVRNYPASSYPRPSARVITEASSVLEVQGEVVTHECSPQGNNRSSSPHNNLANHHMVESKLV